MPATDTDVARATTPGDLEGPRPTSIPAVYVWAGVLSLAVVVAGIVALYALAPARSKPDVTPLFVVIVPAFGTLLLSLSTYLKQRSTHQLAISNGKQLVRITEQTNGGLDARIRDALKEVVDESPHLLTSAVLETELGKLLGERAAERAPARKPRPARATKKTTTRRTR